MNLRRLGAAAALFSLVFAIGCAAPEGGGEGAASGSTLTNGPMLGRVSDSSMGVWVRTSEPGEFAVQYGTDPAALTTGSATGSTAIEDDNTGWLELTGLASNTKYYYTVEAPPGTATGQGGSFHTLPNDDDLRNDVANPDGLFNFRFEFACGNNQNPNDGSAFKGELPTYVTMQRELLRDAEKNKVDFAVLNGDWLYEWDRDYTAEAWSEQVGVAAEAQPTVVSLLPRIVGVWENYKTFLRRGKPLVPWHQNVPSYYTFDDHELLNDIYGSGTPGYVNRRAVFRDIGVLAWYDYLGWTSETEWTQDVVFGEAEFTEGGDTITDASADFTALVRDEIGTLLVPWGTPDAGVMDAEGGDTEGGRPNAGVYGIADVVDKTTLKIEPPARATGTAPYTVGRNSHWKKRVGNAELYFLDTRTHRMVHDFDDARNPDRSMLGFAQRAWLKREMEASDADMFFLFSSVNFMIPHVGGTGSAAVAKGKDDAWTSFLYERDQLIDFWAGLGKPVLILTGDLHNSFAIKVRENVWEFASGPHNSINHPARSEGDRPPNGEFTWAGVSADVRWSSYMLNDTPVEMRTRPFYAVVQVNNVFNNPKEPGVDRWIAYPRPQIVVQYYDGLTGDLAYAESILAQHN